MYREKITPRQLGAWLVAGLCPVAVQLTTTVGWHKLLATSLICLTAVCLVWRWGHFGRWTVIPACALLVVFAGQILKEAASVWTGNSYPAVPLMLLAVALWSSLKGASAAARVGCVLFWAVLTIYPVVFGAAVRDVHWEWVNRTGRFKTEIIPVLLLPTLGKLLLKGKGSCKRLILPGVLAVAGSVITLGILSGESDRNFYEMVRSIDLLGLVKHFEALVSAGATLGWFALLSYILTVCGAAGELVIGKGRPFAIAAAVGAAGWMLSNLHISEGLLALAAAVFWVVVPLLTQEIGVVKKDRKKQK